MVNENPGLLVLMDLRLPGMDGFEATRRIKAQYPESSVIILSSYEGNNYRKKAIEAGADGYVVKLRLQTELIPEISSTLKENFEGK